MRYNFNSDWLFSKIGESNFTTISLPHDAMQSERRKSDNPTGSAGAFYGGGSYAYKKVLFGDEKLKNKTVLLEFEGVYQNAIVYINSKEVHKNAYGYTPFSVDITNFFEIGKDNEIKVTVENEQAPNSRWYTGSGIYRPVWLHVKNKNHFELGGVKISTVSLNPTKIIVESTHTGGDVEIEILDNGKVVAKGKGEKEEIILENAKLWSSEFPNLYSCRAKLLNNGEVCDEEIETFGIRKVEWSNKGLFINGENTLLRGGCLHHDNGILGARSFAKSEIRRAKILKAAGFNAIRASHNPLSKAFIEACDEIGLYVIDEMWDMWFSHKNKFDYACCFMDNYLSDIKATVSRDFNNPSVIMYSIGNEISEPSTDKGVELAKEMVALIHSLDSNKAVTCGVNLMIINSQKKGKGIYKEGGGLNSDKRALPSSSSMFNMVTQMVGSGMNNSANGKDADLACSPMLDSLDIAGYNYASGRYKLDGKLHPNRVIYGSETFPHDIYKNWDLVKQYPYLVGDFMWTAWDYVGETGLGTWAYSNDAASFDKPYPWLLADTGVINILGDEDGSALYAKVVWGLTDIPQIAVKPVNRANETPKKAVWRGTNAMPCWSYKGCEGTKASVEVYSTGSSVSLFLNNKPIGKSKVKECLAEFSVAYEEGVLKAVAYDSKGNVLGENSLISANGLRQTKILPEECVISVGEIAYVKVQVVGENGAVEANADLKLKASVENGELLAFGSANPRTFDEFVDGEYTTYYGRALAVVKGVKEGKMIFSVSDENNEISSAEIIVR